ncbi:MAG: glycosyl transferase [Blastocatellia bacterium AA13]|nr:MAG: glycosyl transferase [Blastocatellia bacterium AA13]
MHACLIAVQGILFFLCLTAIWFYSYSIVAALGFFSKESQINPGFAPPISILKPIRGLDSDAYENLASCCRQDYPDFQIIFGVQDRNDRGVRVVEQIIRDFPDVDIRLVVNARTIGANSKVSNLANIQVEAAHDLLLVADSDIRVGRDYLKRIVQPMSDSKVGVVTCLYRSIPKGFIASIEALGISTEFHGGVLVARRMEGMKFALGSTILMRRSVLDAIGGFAAVADYLADDFLLGNLPAQAGYEVVLSDFVVDHVLDTENLRGFVSHQTRWNRGTRVSRPWGYVGLIFTHGSASSLLFLIASSFSLVGWGVVAATWAVRIAMAWIIGARCLRDSIAARWFWLAPVRDLISFGLWVYSFIGNSIEWRGRRYRLLKGGRLEAVASAGK